MRSLGRLLRSDGEASKANPSSPLLLGPCKMRHSSFSHGQTLAIIGENGAGKSTLLKILSRITLPTKGAVRVYGRLASLLEIGTGFHPEFSGRDNIYLNGTMLGLSRKEFANVLIGLSISPAWSNSSTYRSKITRAGCTCD